MNTYQLLEPVRDGGDFINMEDAFYALNQIMGVVKDSGDKFTIIEIVGTSSSGKTSFKNMLINCLIKVKKFRAFNTEAYGECPSHAKREFFENFPGEEGPEPNVVVLEHSFFPFPHLENFKAKVDTFKAKYKNLSYVYLFLDEFDYYLKERGNMEKKEKQEFDRMLSKIFYGLQDTLASDGKNFVFIFSSYLFLIGDTNTQGIFMLEGKSENEEVKLETYKINNPYEKCCELGLKADRFYIMKFYRTYNEVSKESQGVDIESDYKNLPTGIIESDEYRNLFSELKKQIFNEKYNGFYYDKAIIDLIERKGLQKLKEKLEYAGENNRKMKEVRAEILADLLKKKGQQMKYLLAQIAADEKYLNLLFEPDDLNHDELIREFLNVTEKKDGYDENKLNEDKKLRYKILETMNVVFRKGGKYKSNFKMFDFKKLIKLLFPGKYDSLPLEIRNNFCFNKIYRFDKSRKIFIYFWIFYIIPAFGFFINSTLKLITPEKFKTYVPYYLNIGIFTLIVFLLLFTIYMTIYPYIQIKADFLKFTFAFFFNMVFTVIIEAILSKYFLYPSISLMVNAIVISGIVLLTSLFIFLFLPNQEEKDEKI